MTIQRDEAKQNHLCKQFSFLIRTFLLSQSIKTFIRHAALYRMDKLTEQTDGCQPALYAVHFRPYNFTIGAKVNINS